MLITIQPASEAEQRLHEIGLRACRAAGVKMRELAAEAYFGDRDRKSITADEWREFYESLGFRAKDAHQSAAE